MDRLDLLVRQLESVDTDMRDLRKEIHDLRKELAGLGLFRAKTLGMASAISVILPVITSVATYLYLN